MCGGGGGRTHVIELVLGHAHPRCIRYDTASWKALHSTKDGTPPLALFALCSARSRTTSHCYGKVCCARPYHTVGSYMCMEVRTLVGSVCAVKLQASDYLCYSSTQTALPRND